MRPVFLSLLLLLLAPPAAALAEDVTFRAVVDPVTGGTPTEPAPVAAQLEVAIGSQDRPPAETRELAVAFPPGFTFTGTNAPACDMEDLGVRGPTACPAGSQIGSGEATFVYLPTSLRIRGTTDAMALYSGGPGKLLLYLHVTQPTELAFVFPGVVTDGPEGPLMTFDLREVSDASTGTTAVTKVRLDLPRGGTGVAPPRPAKARRYKACRRLGRSTTRVVCFTCRGRGPAKRCFNRRIERRRAASAPRQATEAVPVGALASGPCPADGRWPFQARLLFRGGGDPRQTADVVVTCTPTPSGPSAQAPAPSPAQPACMVLPQLCPPPAARRGG